jgi:predicted CXXCH cytochrome family protein
MSAAPAFADNGPHVSTSGTTTVDRCAGCHRAHTAQDTYLLKTDQTSLCETCHNGTGATTDVIDGVSTTAGGALRGGGFKYALINTTSGVNKTSVGVLSLVNKQASTSSHDVGAAGTAWGGGTSGNGTAITLQCGSCHDPHGNGNYRILRPVPTDAAGITLPGPFAVTSVTQASVSGTTYTYAVVTAVANTFKVTDPVSFNGTTGGADAIIAGTITAITDSTHFTMTSKINVASATGGKVSWANPQGIANVTGDATNATYTTWNVHGLVAGQSITIAGIAPTGYNVTKALIVSVPSTTTFTVANATVAAYTSGGTISGIADALGTKVYTTGNYWAQDDHNYTGTVLSSTQGSGTAASGGATAFVANISQWCAQCHTRILQGSGAWKTNSGDPMFTFEHRSNNGKEGSPNCIQCHVAHGTNAAMGTLSSGVGTEITGKAGDSFLLRVDSRGTCNMCHNL